MGTEPRTAFFKKGNSEFVCFSCPVWGKCGGIWMRRHGVILRGRLRNCRGLSRQLWQFCPMLHLSFIPGRLDQHLKQKRDRLLEKLLDSGEIDSLTFQLSVAEPIPEKVHPLPMNAYHLVEKAASEKNGQRVHSTIDGDLQERVNTLVERHRKTLAANHIYNLAVVVTEVSTKEVKAYVGNYFNGTETEHGNSVDVIQAPRSTGSILKPFLYCKMLDDGMLTPQMLIPDIPTRFGGFTPMNFDQEYNGAVPAAEALARSLNIPAVKMLQDYGVPPFYSFLKKSGMTSLVHPPDYYGLSLILGGAEVSLWNLSGMYTSLISILKNYDENDGFYAAQPFSKLKWEKERSSAKKRRTKLFNLNCGQLPYI